MSALSDYEKYAKSLGKGKISALVDYIEHCKNNNKNVLFTDVVLNKEEAKLFNKWFNEQLKPFEITNLDKCYSVTLYQDYYWYDWVKEKKIFKKGKFGDGHDYEDLFKKYINDEFPNQASLIKYDSENGMFCIYCNNKKDAEFFAYNLSKLYKDEKKMIKKIIQMKAIYDKEELIFDDEKINI